MTTFYLRKKTDPITRSGCHVYKTIPCPAGWGTDECEYVPARGWMMVETHEKNYLGYDVFKYLDLLNCPEHAEFALGGEDWWGYCMAPWLDMGGKVESNRQYKYGTITHTLADGSQAVQILDGMDLTLSSVITHRGEPMPEKGARLIAEYNRTRPKLEGIEPYRR